MKNTIKKTLITNIILCTSFATFAGLKRSPSKQGANVYRLACKWLSSKLNNHNVV